MKNSFDEKILDEAQDWINANQKVVLATVIQTASPNQRVSLAPGPSEMHFYQIDGMEQVEHT